MSNSTSVPHSEHRYSAGIFLRVFLCWPNLYASPNQAELWIVWCFVQQQVWVWVWVQFRGLNTKDEYSETTDGAWARHMHLKKRRRKKQGPAAQQAPKKTHIHRAGQSVAFNWLAGSYSTVKTRRAAHSPHAGLIHGQTQNPTREREKDGGRETRPSERLE